MRLKNFLLIAVLLAWPALLFAQGGGGPNPQLIPESGSIGSCNFITGEIHFDCIPQYLAYLIKLVFGFIGSICLMNIIRGGYMYAFSGLQGDTTQAKDRIKWALIGLTVSVLAYLIIDTIVSALLSGPQEL